MTMSEPETAPETAQPEAASTETITVNVAEFEALKREAQEWKERCMRSQAEFDNVRKRLRKEADEAGTRAVARAMKPVLTEMDNLGRALAAAAAPEAFAEFAQGVSMISENLRTGLVGQGLEEVPAEGVFDPAVHEVIAEQEDASVVKGTILQVHRTGWRFREQLVRSAQVVVAKPPAPAP
jgi:molecular chaperone GrpE